MQGLNKVMLIGHLGKDPEYLNFENGIGLAKFSLATTENYKEETGKLQTQTEWHQIICWAKLAAYAKEHLRKGQLVYIEGKIKTRTFEDKDNKKRYVTEIVADRISNLEKTGKSNAGSNHEIQETDIENDVELPF